MNLEPISLDRVQSSWGSGGEALQTLQLFKKIKDKNSVLGMILPAQVAPETTLNPKFSWGTCLQTSHAGNTLHSSPAPQKSIEPCLSLVISCLFLGYLGFESVYCWASTENYALSSSPRSQIVIITLKCSKFIETFFFRVWMAAHKPTTISHGALVMPWDKVIRCVCYLTIIIAFSPINTCKVCS